MSSASRSAACSMAKSTPASNWPSASSACFSSAATNRGGSLAPHSDGDPLDLRQVGHRQQARDDRHVDAELAAAIAEAEEVVVVVEQLGDDHVGAGVDLCA